MQTIECIFNSLSLRRIYRLLYRTLFLRNSEEELIYKWDPDSDGLWKNGFEYKIYLIFGRLKSATLLFDHFEGIYYFYPVLCRFISWILI
jgi:hypothetical protein